VTYIKVLLNIPIQCEKVQKACIYSSNPSRGIIQSNKSLNVWKLTLDVQLSKKKHRYLFLSLSFDTCVLKACNCIGPCKPEFYCELFHLLDLDTYLDRGFSVDLNGHSDFTADCSVSLIWTRRFWLLIFAFEMGCTVGVTGRQRMHTPSRYLIQPNPGVRVCSIFRICMSYGIYETDHFSLYYHSDG
jgi:hypothetical protein